MQSTRVPATCAGRPARTTRPAGTHKTSGRSPGATAAGSSTLEPAGPQVLEQERRQPGFSTCTRPDVVAAIRDSYADLGGWPARDKLPVVYNACYNIGFWGLERLHPFDSKKFQHVLRLLEERRVLRADQLVTAREATHEILREVHAEPYLRKLDSSSLKVAMVTELAPLAFLPSSLLRRKVLRPMATMAGGTMLAAALAMEHGWAVNLGGGMHHASHDAGGGWCPYADINLAVNRLRAASGGLVRRVMVIDLDAHQGNGVERCKLHSQDSELFVLDVYCRGAYPNDTAAKEGINIKVEAPPRSGDAAYLSALRPALEQAFAEFPRPDLVIYNAGTDVLAGDPIGHLGMSVEGVVERDQAVWAAALQQGVPILQLLSGGYTKMSTPCIADSIANLWGVFDLGSAAGPAPTV